MARGQTQQQIIDLLNQGWEVKLWSEPFVYGQPGEIQEIAFVTNEAAYESEVINANIFNALRRNDRLEEISRRVTPFGYGDKTFEKTEIRYRLCKEKPKSVFVSHQQWDAQVRRIVKANLKNHGTSLSEASMRGSDLIIDIQDRGMVVRQDWRKRLKDRYLVPPTPAPNNGIPDEYIGDDAREYAHRKARYGNRDWLFWSDRAEQKHAAPQGAASIKAAMLAVGTQGIFLSFERHSGHAYSSSSWGVASLWLKNAKYCERTGFQI